MSKDELKTSATNFGFDPTWIEKTDEKTLIVAIEAARQGLSVNLITEILQKFGPNLLDFIVALLNRISMKKNMTGEIIPGPVIEGTDTSFIDVIIEKYLPIIIEQFLPMILEKFGPQLIQLIQQNLPLILSQFGPQLILLIQQNLPQIIQALIDAFTKNLQKNALPIKTK